MNKVPSIKETVREVPLPLEQAQPTRRMKPQRLLEGGIAVAALKQAFVMLRPDIQWKNPVMFVVEVGAFLTLLFIVQAAWGRLASEVPISYFIALDAWLFLTVLFANFATALAEARGKAQADSLRRARHDTVAYRLNKAGALEEVPSTALKPSDRVVVQAGQLIPGDGEIIQGVASVDESAITGESAPVIRAAGGDRSGVTGGTVVLSDRIVVQITSGAGDSFLDRMIALVEGAIRQRTPNEIALTLLLSAFTLIFLIVVIPLWPMAWNAEQYMMGYLGIQEPLRSLGTDVPTLIALLVCLIPTTIGTLLAAIGIAGMDRALQANIIAKSGKAVELAGDIDVVLLDKTGTITLGNRNATLFLPIGKYSAAEVGRLAALASAVDETPEGKSIVKLFEQQSQTPGQDAAGGRVCAVYSANAHEWHRSSERAANTQRGSRRHHPICRRQPWQRAE
jgi:K+-transporting ATPase ATPase B chain